MSVPVLWGQGHGQHRVQRVGGLDEWGDGELDPEALQDEIDDLGECIHRDLQNGVHRAGFARFQAACDAAFGGV